jgi:ribosomal protein S18 acetylase RimI-like enzyme
MENLEKIQYSSPEDSKEEGEKPQHRFDLIIDGQKIGAAEIDYYSRPLPLYQITDLYVDIQHKGKGYASKILEQVENFLKSKKKPGVLVDAIIDGDPATGMYTRRGWKEVPQSFGLHVFNWPDDVSEDVLTGYPFRYTDLTERKSFNKQS